MPRYDPEATDALLARVPKRYTRGPWKAHRHDDPEGMGDINWQVQQASPPGVVLANVWESDDRNNRADATLIALAPDLASALALAHAEIERLSRHAERIAARTCGKCDVLYDRVFGRAAPKPGYCRDCPVAVYRFDYPAPAPKD